MSLKAVEILALIGVNRCASVVPTSSIQVIAKRYRPAIFRLLIFAVTFLAFARLTTCEFTWWDDQETIHQNPRLNPPTWDTLGYYWTTAGEHSTMGLYVPVTYTVWSGLAKIGRLDHPDAQGLTLNPHVFHTANLLIHALTAVLVFQLLLRLFANDIAALIGALLFAVHPVQVETVGWVSGTKDLLCGFFSVAALLVYVRSIPSRGVRYPEHPDPARHNPAVRSTSQTGVEALPSTSSNHPRARRSGRWWNLLGFFFFILAMLSKPTGVVVPLMAATIAIYLLNRPVRSTILSLIPWFVLMIPCLIWTKLVQPATWTSPLPLWARPAVAADAIAFYLCKLVWPIHLCVDYGHNPQAIVDNQLIYFTWILPSIVIALLWWKREKARAAISAAMLFVLPLIPVLGFVGFEFQQISTTSDHYLYLPLLGAAILASWAMTKITSPHKIAAAILILAALGVRTILQEPTWQDTRSVFYHALDLNPHSVVSSDGLGFLTGREARRLTRPDQQTQARKLFEQSIAWYQRSISFAPDSVPSIFNLALDYQAIGRGDLGRQQMHRIVELQPQLPPEMRVDPIDLAHRLYNFPDVQGAIDWLDEVIRRDPGNAQAIVLRAKAIEHLHGNPK